MHPHLKLLNVDSGRIACPKQVLNIQRAEEADVVALLCSVLTRFMRYCCCGAGRGLSICSSLPFLLRARGGHDRQVQCGSHAQASLCNCAHAPKDGPPRAGGG